MNNSKNDNIKIAVSVICIVLEAAFLLYQLYGLGIFIQLYEPGDAMYIGLQSIASLYGIVLLVISILGIFKIKQGKPALLSGFFKKIAAGWVAFGCTFIPAKQPIPAAVILGAGVLIAGMTVFFRSVMDKSGGCDSQTENYIAHRFECDGAAWTWESAAEEYCRIHGKTLEELTEYDNDKIYDYAGNNIVYFLTWIIKNDLYSEYFRQEYGMDMIGEIKNEKTNPVEFFGAYMERFFSVDDLSERILPFMNSYYVLEASCRNGKYRYYWDDYYETIRNDDHIVYCIDFSWDIYHRLEEKINERYKYFLIENESGDMTEVGTMRWEMINEELTIEAAEGVSPEYIGLCVNHMNNLSDSVIDGLCDELADWYGLGSEMPDVENDKRKILEHLNPDSICIYPPHGDEPAFSVGCEPDFEQEHGISWSVRGDELLEVTHRMDIGLPWSYENELAYRIAKAVKQIDPIRIDSYEKALCEAEKGVLTPLYLKPVRFNGAESETNRVFVPQIIAELKERYDTLIEDMMLNKAVDSYSCEPRYKEKSVVPSQLVISAKKCDKCVFFEIMHIW